MVLFVAFDGETLAVIVSLFPWVNVTLFFDTLILETDIVEGLLLGGGEGVTGVCELPPPLLAGVLLLLLLFVILL